MNASDAWHGKKVLESLQCITLTTDFGMADGYAGVLKGVIWSICPGAHIADLSHLVEPQNILHGALVLARHARYFPPGTVHVAVVDPGVGTARRAIAGRVGQHLFCGPDNGIFTPLVDEFRAAGHTAEFYHLDQPRFWLPEVSPVFHGRDIFAPAAAHLACGTPLQELGSPLVDPVLLRVPQPIREGGVVTGQVLYADAFGNLVTNLTASHLPAGGKFRLEIQGISIGRVVKTFGEAHPGDLVLLAGSAGWLEVSVVNGSAARQLGASGGTGIILYLEP